MQNQFCQYIQKVECGQYMEEEEEEVHVTKLKNKGNISSNRGDKYFEERRNERNQELAPPSNLYTENTSKYCGQQFIKQQTPAQSRLFGQGVEVKPLVIPTDNKSEQCSIKEKKTILKDNISAPTKSPGSVLNIPLPSNHEVDEEVIKFTNYVNDAPTSIGPPLFDFSIPPPNVISAAMQKTQVPHFYPYPYSVAQQSSHMYYSANPVGQQIDYNRTVGMHHSQETHAGICQDTSHVTPPSHPGQQSVLSNTQTPFTANNLETPTQPPKQKLNIIDPRFIQNKDVVSQNPGNMSLSDKKGQTLKKDNSQIDNEVLTDDQEQEIGKQSSFHSESSFWGKPVVYE